MKKRRCIKREKSLERLAEEARRFREAARALPPGIGQELLLNRARQAERAAHINDRLKSPGLKPPDNRRRGVAASGRMDVLRTRYGDMVRGGTDVADGDSAVNASAPRAARNPV